MGELKRIDHNIVEGAQEVSFFMKQREALGIPESLNQDPVLYTSSHRGAFNAQIKEHVKAFQRMAFHEGVADGDKDVSYLNLSEATTEEVIGMLWDFMKKLDSTNDKKLITDQNNKKVVPLPGFLINVMYLPALDESGESTGGSSRTFAIDLDNYKSILPKLAELLKEKDVIPEDGEAQRLQETTRKSITSQD